MRTGTHYLRALGLHLKASVRGKSRFDPPVLFVREKKFAYLPVPKAANTSIRYALSPTFGFPRDTVTSIFTDERFPLTPLSQIIDEITDDWFFFTVVRDPYARAFSAYNDKLVKQNGRFKALRTMGAEKDDSFASFLKMCRNWPRPMLNDHFLPQRDFLARALGNPYLEQFRMETLATTWPEICGRIKAQGLPKPDALEFENVKSNASTTKRPFTAEELHLLESLYQEDYQALGLEKPETPTA